MSLPIESGLGMSESWPLSLSLPNGAIVLDGGRHLLCSSKLSLYGSVQELHCRQSIWGLTCDNTSKNKMNTLISICWSSECIHQLVSKSVQWGEERVINYLDSSPSWVHWVVLWIFFLKVWWIFNQACEWEPSKELKKKKKDNHKILDLNPGDSDPLALRKCILKAPKVILILIWKSLNITELYTMKTDPRLLWLRLTVKNKRKKNALKAEGLCVNYCYFHYEWLSSIVNYYSY